jgi:hypothetical protein
MASREIWPTARKPQKVAPADPNKARKINNNKNEKVRSCSDEGGCQTAWLIAYWGPFGRQRRAWPHGAGSPHFHMHIGKNGQFFEVWGFP